LRTKNRGAQDDNKGAGEGECFPVDHRSPSTGNVLSKK